MPRTYPSLLSRDESSAFKGILILLVVLGHNSILMKETNLFPYLYSFHVYCFYILPFLYGITFHDEKKGNCFYLLKRQINHYRKLGLIYLFWCLMGVLLAIFVKQIPFQPWKCIQAILWGHQTLLKDYCGFSFLWFIPTFLAVMLWRDVYFLSTKLGKKVLFYLGVFLWCGAVAGMGGSHSLGMWCPFALIQGLFFSMAGIAVRFILEQTRIEDGTISKCYCLLFPIIPLYVYFRRFLPYGFNYLTWSCCPILAFLCLYSIKNYLTKCRLFLLAGKYSLQVYLLHTIVFNILLLIVKQQNIITGIISYFATLVITAIGIWFADRFPPLRWAIFPFDLNQTKEKIQSKIEV